MRKEKKGKKIISKLVLLFCFAALNIFIIQTSLVKAQVPTGYGPPSIIIRSPTQEAQDKAKWSWEKAMGKLWEQLKQQGGSAFKAALGNFLNNMAYDYATYLASGDWGQGPMHEPRDLGMVLSDAADNAGGTFIETLGQGTYKFNLCEPSFGVSLQIGLGLEKAVRPEAPKCTWSEMRDNWEEEINDPDFLKKFQASFNPWESDLGIALSLQTGIEEEINKAMQEDLERLKLNQGWKSVTEPITNVIKTPASLVAEKAGLTLEDAATKEKTYTGTFADAIDLFSNTLVSKLFEKWFKDGIWTGSLYDIWGDEGDLVGSSIYDPEAQAPGGGVKAAKARFKSLVKPDFTGKGNYDILSELETCSDPNKAGPTNCVITRDFRQAIEEKKTVGEAMDERYLNPNGTFGFDADGKEPKYYADNAYPYRSIIILRKFRIIPVGWELAAQYIQDNLSGIGGAKNLSELVACFDKDDEYTGYNDSGFETWCAGLVDPNWVLKAPFNYCQRQGPGPEMITDPEPIGSGEESMLMVNRKDDYCADEKTCIIENNDGSCARYGYCTEERRKWNSNANSCDPKFNTCQTFNYEGGGKISYLENSLNYTGCTGDNAGCRAHAISSISYDSGTDTVTWDASNVIYFDRDAEECDSDEEGCRGLIRTKPGAGANLLPNSSFETIADSDVAGDGSDDTFEYWGIIGQAVSDSFSGMNSVQLSGALNHTITIDAAYYTVTGETFSLSFYAEDCSSGSSAWLGVGENSLDFEATGAGSWPWFQISYTYPTTGSNQVSFNISGNGNCKIDAIKLERSRTATAYSDYEGEGLIYERLLPDYLEDTCYISSSNYQYKDTAPYVPCYSYARKCNADEIDCEYYTSATDGFSVPARVVVSDYCPAECVGYDTYIQGATRFDSSRQEIFIPGTARTCSISAVGCDEFTNLDEVEQGGEGIEYYSYLRQCHKPSDPGVNCAEFYVWEGSDQAGYQLYVYSLVEGAGGEPEVTDPGSDNCDETIYRQDPTGDCRQFYNKAGEDSYHLLSLVYICSDECIPFRRTEVNTDPGTGDPDESCIGGGEWNDQNQACIYQAIPGESRSCGASQAGCREYSGNAGNNMRILFTNDFEDGTQGWTPGASSPESVIVGERSLRVGDSTTLTVGSLVEQGRSYVLSFIAKSGGASSLEIKFVNDAGEESVFSSVDNLNSNWSYYKVNLANLDHEVSIDENLTISGGNTFYIDNIMLTEIIDRYFLIKKSWPVTCDYDTGGEFMGPSYNLGCDQYYDRNNVAHYLRKFSYLCQESAVGCELMIDTKNSKGYSIATSTTNPIVTVPQDDYIYAVYDPDKRCSQGDKGCQRLGVSYQYATTTLFSDIYLKNDPDQYSAILCDQQATDCEEWVDSDGVTAHFKNPGNQVCQWRQQQGVGTGGWGWWKKEVYRCDDNYDDIVDLTDNNGEIDIDIETTVCLNNNDCGTSVSETSISCILDNNDYACPINKISLINKTFGYGGPGNSINQPSVDNNGNYWAGLCPVDQAGCSEFIDPVSSFSVNLVFNGDFSQNVDGNDIADGWSASANGVQSIVLTAHTLYILAVEGNNSVAISAATPVYYQLEENNQLNGPLQPPANPNNELRVTSTGPRVSAQFYIIAPVSGEITVTNALPNNGSRVEVKRAAIDYQLKQEVDLLTCNVEVDFSNGCVLFNRRVIKGAGGYYGLDINADLTADGENPNYDNSPFNANQNPIKVRPDRTCDKWLACRSYIKDEDGNNVCLDVGLCDSLDETGNCDSFVLLPAPRNQTYPTAGQFSNLSGYTKVGYSNSSLQSDYYHLGAMEQEGEVGNISNGSFEIAGSNGYPLGWIWEGGVWDENVFKVIDNPWSAVEEEKIGYAKDGRNFLRLGATFSAASEYADVTSGTDYILTAYINTSELTEGIARIKVENSAEPPDELLSMPLDKGLKGWRLKLGDFSANDNKIRVILYADSSPTGKLYFDDIKIKPALHSKWDTAMSREWYTPQTCRLYPQDDALSCDYYDDVGIRQKGWSGYCLEYDRSPGLEDACLLWYPIDKVKGEGVEEGAGYSSRFPLYYCIEVDEYTTDDEIEVLGYNKRDSGPINVILPMTGQSATFNLERLGLNQVEEKWLKKENIHHIRFHETWPSIMCGDIPQGAGDRYIRLDSNYFNGEPFGWGPEDHLGWELNFFGPGGIFSGITSFSRDWGCDHPDHTISEVVIYSKAFYCSKIVQTVNSVGQNKYWSNRISRVSDYTIPCNSSLTVGVSVADFDTCNYFSDYFPFGSIVYPSPAADPASWDSKAGIAGNQPLYYEDPDASLSEPYQVRMGQEQEVDNVQRLFAQSYGTWEWTAQCVGGVDNPTDGRDCVYDGQCQCYLCGDDCANGFCQNTEPATPYCDIGVCADIVGNGVCIIKGNPAGGCNFTCNCVDFACACGPDAGAVCEFNSDCRGDTTCGPEICVGGSNSGSTCVDDSGCPMIGLCSNSGRSCDSDTNCACSACDPLGTCINSTCVSGTCALAANNNQSNMPCSNNYDCACRFDDCQSGRCDKEYQVDLGGPSWGPPSSLCNSSGILPRPVYPNDYCAILPTIPSANIQVDDSVNNVIIQRNGFIKLDFNSIVDSEQLPLVMYAVRWGDNEETIVSGVEMSAQPNEENPHSLYHLYSYWDLKGKEAEPSITCVNDCSGYGASGACCVVQPRIQIKDNWGWCNGGSACNQWQAFTGWIVVTEW